MPVTLSHASIGSVSAGCKEFASKDKRLEKVATTVDGARHAVVDRVDTEWSVQLVGISTADMDDWRTLWQTAGTADLVTVGPDGIPGAPGASFSAYITTFNPARMESLGDRWRLSITLLQPDV